MKRKMLTKMLCTALMVSLTVPMFTVTAAQDELPVMEAQAEVYVGTGEDGQGIVPYFGTVGHVDRQCAYVVSQLNLNAEQKSVMVAAAIAADDQFSEVRGFHARKNSDGSSNYLANLKALEICGVRIDKESDLPGYVLGRLSGIGAQDKNDVRQMIAAILDYVEDKNYTLEQKRYAIAGFGVHLIGDMFAHRTIIKKACLTNWGSSDTPTNKFFQTSDFIPATLDKFKSEIQQGKLCTVDMKPYMNSTITGEYFNDKTGKWEKAGRKGELYIDNIHFMPNRIRAGERAAASFVETVFTTGIGFPDINYYLTEYNLQLENFAQYKSVL